MALVGENRPDVVIAQIDTDLGTARKVLSRIRSASPDSRIVVLTMFDNLLYLRVLSKMGIDAYIHKSSSAEELGDKLRETNEARGMAERELAEIERRRGRLEQLERDRGAIMEHYAGTVPEALDGLTGEERHQVYWMIRLRVTIRPGGGLDAEGVLREPVCTLTGTS